MTSILGKTDMYEIASEITRNTIGLLGFEDCVIYLIEGNEKELIQIAAFGDKLCEEDGVRNKITIPVGHGIVGAVAKTGLPEIINDTSKDKRYIVDDKVRFSEIAVPIIANNEIIGVIDSEHSQKYFFNTDHLKTLQTIAGLAATQLKNAVILREKDKAAKEKEILLKNLKKSNNELKDFAHIVSHDLKSPLRSINALLNWMQEDYGHLIDTSERNHIELLLKKVDKMDDLIQGILQYASVDKIDNTEKKIDLNVLVRDGLDTVYHPSNITISIQENLPIINGDDFRLKQLFQNLLSNAIKYCNQIKGDVALNYISKDNFWQFEITDNGMGIDAKYYKKIFQIFQVLEDSENSTGVGLSIVKKIVEFYGGKIWVTSKLKKGTTFYFTLPK